MDNKTEYKAKMTLNQFIVLTKYIKSFDIVESVKSNTYFQNIKLSKNASPENVKKWIFNGWNTERILRVNDEFLNIEDNYFALQWSFPQAYYSIFMLTLSFMKLNGQNTSSHSGIMNKYSEYIISGKYPKSLSFYCLGTKKNPTYHNIKKNNVPNSYSIEFEPDSIESCKTQIRQFLKATRKILLVEKRKDKNIAKKFKTGKGKNRRNKKILSEKDWEIIAEKVKATNILHLLYRKRIKSNYQDIDSFTYEDLKADYIHKSLIGIVKKMNLVHEMYIYKMIGSHKYIDFYEEYKNGNDLNFLDKRIKLINNEI